MIIVKFKTRDITKQLEKYEEKKNVKLPEEYRNFLLKYNGGETDQTSFDINGYENSIRAFYGFIDKTRDFSINNYIHDYIVGDAAQKNILLIATLAVGDQLAIGVGKNNYGYIYALDHEMGFKGTKVADSFNEFVKLVESIPVDKDSLEHPKDKIERIARQDGMMPDKWAITIYWEQYNEMLNAEYEEVVLD